MLSLRTIALAACLSAVSVAGCNGILGIDPGHLDDAGTDAGITDSALPDVTPTGPCSFDNPNSQFDKGCTFGP